MPITENMQKMPFLAPWVIPPSRGKKNKKKTHNKDNTIPRERARKGGRKPVKRQGTLGELRGNTWTNQTGVVPGVSCRNYLPTHLPISDAHSNKWALFRKWHPIQKKVLVTKTGNPTYYNAVAGEFEWAYFLNQKQRVTKMIIS